MEIPPASAALEKLGIPHRIFRHENPVTSFEQAAAERGQRVSQIVRSILFRLSGDEFVMVLIAGFAQVSWKILRRHLGSSRMTMATEDEVFTVTGYPIGAVSPFGLPNRLRVLVDESVIRENEISLGSGIRNTALILKSADLQRALNGTEILSLTENQTENPMNSFKQRTLDFLEIEWGTYIERFNRLPSAEGLKRVNKQGYEQFRDMLAHILAWWEEGMEIILAIAEGREYERKKYDFDVFNAEAVAKYKTWDETEFLSRFEQTRLKAAADLMSMNEAAWENRRLRGWVNGIFIHHAREHLVALSRFLVLDILQNDWATYVEDFNQLDEEQKKEFISKQGFGNFHDLLAHIIGWWEECVRIVNGILNAPNFTWQDPEVDAFNLELTKKYSSWSNADLLKHYEAARAAMLELASKIPDEAFLNPDIENWLASDVVLHYHDHVI